MRLLYQLGLGFYSLLLHLASFAGHRKASLWIDGRKGWKERIAKKFNGIDSSIWIHCSSLGEYELSVPLIHALKKSNPNEVIFVSFFSPSGFEVKKNDALVFHVDYLPVDSPAHANTLIQLIKPKMVFFAKYDFWYHYLHALRKHAIPTYLFSASFRPSQVLW
jgi:3-deoxy-D-manno-octulosonic-acid transferase